MNQTVQSSDVVTTQTRGKRPDPLLKRIPLVEVFGPTLQGEGAMIGVQTYFLRFGLCDYRCKMCDSLHAVLPEQVKANAEWLTQQEIFDRLTMFADPGPQRKWVTFSGGNPCIHNLADLCNRLLESDKWFIAVETQGTFAPDWLDTCKMVTVSPKSPGMGEKFEEDKLLDFLNKFWRHEGLRLKIVVFSPEDLAFARHVFELVLAEACMPIRHMYLSQGNPFPPNVKSPPDNHVWVLIQEYLRLFDLIKIDPILSQTKFLPQLHVWLWGNRQGV